MMTQALADIRALAAQVDTAAICDAAKDTRVMSGLRCRSRNPILCAPAMTVRCHDDFFGLIRALDRARPDHVIVVDGGGRETALAGELFARAALSRGLAGLVVDGAYRDMDFIATCDLPVYSRHVSPMAGTTARLGALDEPVTCGGVTVRPGDIVIADLNGIVLLEPDTAADRLTAALRVKTVEAEVVARLQTGAALQDCLNVAEHAQRLASGEPSTLRFTI